MKRMSRTPADSWPDADGGIHLFYVGVTEVLYSPCRRGPGRVAKHREGGLFDGEISYQDELKQGASGTSPVQVVGEPRSSVNRPF